MLSDDTLSQGGCNKDRAKEIFMRYVYYVSNLEGDIALTRSATVARRAAKSAHKQGLNFIQIECYEGEYHGSGGHLIYTLAFDGKRFRRVK